MAETLNFTFGWELDGKPEVRRKTETVAISLATGEPHYAEHTIADATSAGVFGEDVIWSAGDGGKDTFEVCMLLCNVAMWYEFKDDAVSPNFIAKLQPANLPLIFGPNIGAGTSSVFDAAVLVEATDYDQTVLIEAHNDATAGVGDGLVKMWMW
jgi:hypothetical protein